MLKEVLFPAAILTSGTLQATEPAIVLGVTVKASVSAVWKAWTAWREQLLQWHAKEEDKQP